MALNKFSEVITAKVIDSKAIMLSLKYTQCMLSVIGCSAQISSLQESIDRGTHQVTIYPSPGKDCILAVCALRRSVTCDMFYGFLHISWKEKDGQQYPFIELEEMWAPSSRIGHIEIDVISVQIQGKNYYYIPESRKQYLDRLYPAAKQGAVFVGDPNLLCRYLIGDATEEDVTATYKEQIQKVKDAQMIIVLNEENAALKEQLQELNRVAFRAAKAVAKLPKFLLPKAIASLADRYLR